MNRTNLGKIIIEWRRPIAAILLAITCFMAYQATKVTIATRFVDLFPAKHPFARLYQEYNQYGGADTTIFMIEVKHGDIFNTKTLQKIQDIQFAANSLPLVNHNEVFSIASYLTYYVKASPGTVEYRCYMYPDVPQKQADIDALRETIDAHKEQLRGLIAPDFKSAAVVASFNETGPAQNYSELFNNIQAIVKKYQDANHIIYVTGQPVVRGYGYYYFPVILAMLVVSIATMVVVLYLSLGNFRSWWVPLVTGSCSALWGLGFVGLRGYNFDPLMLVVPLLLTARDMSHGVQWQKRYYYVLGEVRDHVEACVATTNYMLPAGLLAIAADVSGIFFISFSGIRVLDHMARGGTAWLLASLLMVFVFQPILMSYLPVAEREGSQALPGGIGTRLRDLADTISRFGVEPGPARIALLVGAAIFLAAGLFSGMKAQVGYRQAGTPLYRANAKVNRDIHKIIQNFPVDEAWVIVQTPMTATQNPFSFPVLHMEDNLRDYILRSPGVREVSTFATDGIKPFTRVIHGGHPKFLALPQTIKLIFASVLFFMHSKAPGDMEQFNWHNTSCVRVLLQDHTARTLNDLRRRLAQFQEEYISRNPELSQTRLLYLGGVAGLYAAANDVLFELDLKNIAFVLVAIFLFCAVTFRSIVAGVLFVLVCVVANFGAFIYMHLRSIGLTIDTVPVISLGIGLGVDYGIYTVSRIRDEVAGGLPLDEAVILARRGTGGAVAIVLAIMVGALIPWIFSPALFHFNMSLMLALLMFLNAIAGVMVLPSFIAWSKSNFITRWAPAQVPPQAQVSGSAT
ncbi:MAG TPA: MMPL family transporter [Candidatus Binataceae bacterium]|nr:MMPL family transporter [Candidatus Binataceae bacterium]